MFRMVGIGEILWDVFPDGPRFGGAPANFCCSAAELAGRNARVEIAGAVGDDELGHAAIAALQNHGVATSLLQTSTRGTGKVDVELDSCGIATYQFAADRAWDNVIWQDNLAQSAAQCDVVCFGTLGQRSPRSRATIQDFVRGTRESALRILDVNLRPPFIDDALIRESLSIANVLKLNEDELPQIAQLCGVSGSETEIMRQLANKENLRHVALTRGSKGAVLVSSDAISDLPGIPTTVVDTVGAGDAFTAAMALGLLAGDNIQTVNRNAIEVASFVCSQPGATMAFPEHLLSRLQL